MRGRFDLPTSMLLAVSLWPFAGGAEDATRVRIRPEPIGAAAKFTESRALGDAQPELPVDGLSAARLPASRGTSVLSTTQTVKPLTTIGTSTLSGPKVPSSTTPVLTSQVSSPATTRVNVTDASVSSVSSVGIKVDASATQPAPTDLSRISSQRLGGALPGITTGIKTGTVGGTGATSGAGSKQTDTGDVSGDDKTPNSGTVTNSGDAKEDAENSGSTAEDASATDAEGKSKRSRLPPEQIAAIVVEKLQLLAQLREERLAREALEQQQRERIDGPSALGTVNLLEGLHVDAKVSLDVADILRTEHEIYQDGNAKSGRFYYLPARYDLAWDAEHQYGLTVIYGSAASEGAEGQVLMAARLQSGVDTRELKIVRELTRAYVRRHAKDRDVQFETLLPFALAGTTDVSLFGGAQNEFTIPQDQISVQGASELLGVIDVSWAADQRRLLNVESLLRTKAGIHGQIGLAGAGAAKLARAIPLSIDVASPRTFGRITFERDAGFRNATHYPLRFRTLHALVLARKSKGRVREGDPVVYSWDLKDTVVAPGAAVEWDAEEVPEWLDSRALLQWVEYAVERKCEACDARVFDEKFIPSAAATRPVVMTATDVFEATGASRLAVRLRSKHLTPSRELAALPQVMLSEDGAPKAVAQLFVSEAELAADEPLYDYQLELTFPDGRSYAGSEWTPTRNLDLLLGSANVRKLTGLPDPTPPAP
jgi:hypothetical protein